MKHTDQEYIFLGKQVVKGKYVQYSTFILALVLALLIGVAVGRYLFPAGGAISLPQAGVEAQAPSGQNSNTSAILLHEEQLRANPNDAEGWEHLGNLYFNNGQAADAIRAYETSLELKPGNTSVLVDCGVMYRDLSQYDKALEYFGRALRINPRHEIALFNTGIVLYHDLNRKEDALQAWRKLVTINPQAKTPRGGLVSDLVKDLEAGTR